MGTERASDEPPISEHPAYATTTEEDLLLSDMYM